MKKRDGFWCVKTLKVMTYLKTSRFLTMISLHESFSLTKASVVRNYVPKHCISTYFIDVDRVMSKAPIRMMAAELDVRPFIPLLQRDGKLESLEIHNIPKALTDDLLTMQIEGALEASEVSSAKYKCQFLIY